MNFMKTNILILLIITLFYSCEKKYQELTLVELDKKELLLRVNEESTLVIDKYYPEKPKDLLIEWYSFDTMCATVIDGLVKGVSPGETYVYATVNGVESISCKITVIGVYDKDYDVYILGNHGSTLIYWKNGLPTKIKESKNRIIGKAIVVQNDDVFIAADDYSDNGQPIAKYWKNGEEFVLSEQKSGVTDLAVFNSSVYVVGYEVDETGLYVATLWKNGVVTYLDSGGKFSMANAITIFNGDVYVAGYKMENEDNELYEIAKYWKNGEENLIAKNSTARANDIAIIDNKVFVLFNETVNDVVLAKIWEDGKVQILSENNTPTIGCSMTKLNHEIHVAGYIYNNNLEHSFITIWENGQEKRLSENTLFGDVCKIISVNNDIFVLANEHHPNFFGPKYWKNKKETFFVDYNDVSYVNDITIVPKK